MSESRGQVLWAFGFAGLGVPGDRPPPSQGGDLPQQVAAHGRRPAYHATSKATGGGRWQRLSLVLAVSTVSRFACDCHRLQPRASTRLHPDTELGSRARPPKSIGFPHYWAAVNASCGSRTVASFRVPAGL